MFFVNNFALNRKDAHVAINVKEYSRWLNVVFKDINPLWVQTLEQKGSFGMSRSQRKIKGRSMHAQRMHFFTIYGVQIFTFCNKKIYHWTIDINDEIKRKSIQQNEPFRIRTIIINRRFASKLLISPNNLQRTTLQKFTIAFLLPKITQYTRQ